MTSPGVNSFGYSFNGPNWELLKAMAKGREGQGSQRETVCERPRVAMMQNYHPLELGCHELGLWLPKQKP